MSAKCRGQPRRWSANRKAEIVVRLLKGESLDALSREIEQPASMLSRWREEFFAGGAQMLKRHTDDPQTQALEAERERLKAKVGELTMANELLHEKIHRLEDNRPLVRRRLRQ